MFGFLKKIFSSRALTPAPRFGSEELARRLGVTVETLRAVPVLYQTFQIPKRSGGTRIIKAPGEPLKQMQRKILHKLLRQLRAHPAATGFERGHSIVTNALPHVGQEMVIRLDIQDFFGSTLATRVEAFFRRIGWDAESSKLLAALCTHDGSLPQGAPTSPRLSNLLNHRLDARLATLAKCKKLAYSRYADDVTFSGARRETQRNTDVIHAAKEILTAEGYALHMHKKLRIMRRNRRQVVTGLVVNEKVALPRATRRRLRAVEHQMRTEGTATLTPEQLAGWRALQSMIAIQAKAT